MRALVELLPVVLVLAGVYWLGRRSGRLEVLTRGEVRELKRLRARERWLVAKAAEHSALGDDFAVIVAAKLNEEKEIG